MNNDEQFNISAVILANGSYPQNNEIQHILETATYIVCCDGAADELIRHSITPNLIIGDGDSISPKNKALLSPIFHQIDDQETNDQTKAVHYLTSQGKNGFIILGATGKREDHTLGNISLLIDYMCEGIQVKMYTDHGIFIPLKDNQVLTSYPGQQISIFNFGTTGMTATSLKYPIRDFTNWWQGTLNEALSDKFKIHAEGNYLIYKAY